MTSYHGQTLRNIVYYHNMQYEIHPRSQSQENGQNAFSWIINEREFFRTNGRVRFFPLLCWSFMPSFGKILRPVFRESCLQTDQPTDQPTIPSLTSTVVENCNLLSQLSQLQNCFLTSWLHSNFDFFSVYQCHLWQFVISDQFNHPKSIKQP